MPLVANVDASFVVEPQELRDELVGHICGSVRWVDTVAALDRAGVTTYYEIGPGKVLAGLIGRCAPGATVLSAERLLAESCVIIRRSFDIAPRVCQHNQVSF